MESFLALIGGQTGKNMQLQINSHIPLIRMIDFMSGHYINDNFIIKNQQLCLRVEA